MPPRWNDEMTCKFVKSYKEQECLWNTHNTLYKCKDARQSALKKLVNTVGLENFTIVDAKQKIKSLRSTYQQELSKIDKSLNSGVSLEDVYKPTMKWFAIMTDVMENSVSKRGTISSEFIQLQDLKMEIFDAEDNAIQTDDSENLTEKNETPPDHRKKPATDFPNNSTPCFKKKKTIIREDSDTVCEQKSLNEIINRPEQEAHECDVFAKHIAEQLRQLSTVSCVLAQKDIQNVLTKYRIRDLKTHSRKHH